MTKGNLFTNELQSVFEFWAPQAFASAIFILDRGGLLVFANEAGLQLATDTEGDAVGKSIMDVSPDYKEYFAEAAAQKVGKTGEFNRYRVIILPLPPVSGEDMVLVVFQDISFEQRLPQIVKKYEELKEESINLLEGISDGVYITDGEGLTLYMNQSDTEVIGIPQEEVIGIKMQDIVKSGKLTPSATLAVLESKQKSSVLQHTPNGKTVLVTGTPLFDEAGNIRRVVSSTRDITELNYLRNRIDQERRLSDRYYTELMSLKAEHMTGISGSLSVRSKKMYDVVQLAIQVAQTDSTVMIQGESGVGKDVIARLIHSESRRANGPFIKINCAAIPEHLLESELFGYEGGAFTGAKKGGKAGLVELANKGTLFLDEIGEMPLSLQPKILQLIQEKTFIRVGGTTLREVNVRIIAATNRDLQEQIKQGRFREDLYYRLNVIPVYIAPLRDRIEDIPPLSYTFMTGFNEKYERDKALSGEVVDILQAYHWPGNVRELENLIERLVVLVPSDNILPEHLPDYIRSSNKANSRVTVSGILSLREAFEEVEKQLFSQAYDRTHNTYKAAELLGVSQPTVVRKLQKYKNGGKIHG